MKVVHVAIGGAISFIIWTGYGWRAIFPSSGHCAAYNSEQ
jgi:hypothetical protein